MALLEVSGLMVSYGLIRAIKGVDFTVEQGEIVALIGANGAGKTTIMHALSNLIPKQAGKVIFDGQDITSVPAHKLVEMGMAQVPEGRRIFQELTVAENLSLGAYTRRNKKEIADTLEDIYRRFPILKERQKQIAGTLSGGEQQMLAVGRALMAKPKLVMMDEPSLGLAPLVVKGIFDIIKEINRQGITVLLIEQNANMALKTADWAYVMQTGTILMQGEGKELLENEEVKAAYLGKAK